MARSSQTTCPKAILAASFRLISRIYRKDSLQQNKTGNDLSDGVYSMNNRSNRQERNMRKRILIIGAAIAVALLLPVHVIADQGRPDLATIFNGNYQQDVDRFGTVTRTAFDASGGRVIGTQIGTYRSGAPNGMTIEMTYLEPDAEHPRGQAFDGAGKPMQLH
jgi:hypothetical protein